MRSVPRRIHDGDAKPGFGSKVIRGTDRATEFRSRDPARSAMLIRNQANGERMAFFNLRLKYEMETADGKRN